MNSYTKMGKMKFICILRRFLLSVILLLATCVMQAQENQPDPSMWANPFPRTPDVAALEKFGDYPVGYHTGTVNVSVPIFQFQLSNTLTLPISIDYHTSGIKVEELPSSVGLGWALNAGGCISREVRGMQDEFHNGYYNFIKRNIGYRFQETVNIHDTSLIDSITSNKIDPEPDMFHLNLLGRSYKFFVGSDGKFYTNPYSNLRITACPLNSREATDIWIVTDDYGNKFYFGTEAEYGGTEYSEQHLWIVASAWKLFKVESPEGNILARFKYIRSEFDSPVITRNICKYQDNSLYYYNGNPRNLQGHIGYFSTQKKTRFTGCYLNEIQIPATGTIRFIQGTSHILAANRLIESISFKGCDGNNKQSYDFEYSGDRCYLSAINRRGTEDHNAFFRQFAYYEGLPSIYSRGQDFWGYYNGADNNKNMIPYIPDFIHNGIDFANRYPTEKAKAGSLKHIVYPTGGKTTFEYENNNIYTNASSYTINRVSDLLSLNDYGGIQSDTLHVAKKEIFSYKVRFSYNPMESYKIRLYLKDLRTGNMVINKEGNEMTSATGGMLVGYSAEGFPIFSYESSLEINPGLYQWNISDSIIEPHAARHIRPSVKIEYDYYTNIANNEYHEETVGGIRIKKLTNYDSDNKIIEEREYSYLTPSGVSSGYGSANPFFAKHYIEEIDYERRPTDFINFYCGIYELQEENLLRVPGNIVQYQYITEERKSGGLRFRTDFTYDKRVYQNPSLRSNSFYYKMDQSPFPYSQNEHMEGLIRSKIIYQHKQGVFKPVKKEHYEYHIEEMLNNSMGDLAVGLTDMVSDKGMELGYDSRYMMVTYRLFSSKVLPSRTIVKDIFGDDTITTVSEYSYSKKDYVHPTKMIKYTSGSNEVSVDSFHYCHDFSDEIYRLMKNRNIVAPVICRLHKYKGKTTVRETDYAWFLNGTDTLILPSASKTIRGNASEYTGFLQYDRFGNPLHVCLNGVDNRFILWSYGGRYPVAEIIGDISFDDVCNAVETVFGKDIHALSETLIPDPDILASGLLHSILPLAEVRTFTYDSINGVTAITDSEGLTTEYRYDDFGRLAEVLIPYLQGGAITPKTTSTYDYQYRIP